MSDIRHKMSKKHETDIAEWLEGLKSPGSGNTANRPMDGRTDRKEQEFAFAWDCKCTFSEGISVTKSMWKKAREQSLGERTLLPLRFYDNERFVGYTDLVVLDLNDFIELSERANGR